jgi:succinoglycan biosynthesis transport protein ExoP
MASRQLTPSPTGTGFGSPSDINFKDRWEDKKDPTVEDLEQENQQGLNLQQVAGIVRRRRWHFLLPLFIGWVTLWGASWFLPSVYKSGTTIIVEQPTVSKELLPSNVNDDLQDRLQSITTQILSRTRLLHIIDSLDLYPDQKARGAPDELVARMRKDTEIELVRASGSQELTSFNISFSAHDPRTAQRVTSELTSLFINENLEMTNQEATDTTSFFESQLEAAGQALSSQEEKIRVFKDQHSADLPSQMPGNLAILNGLQSQLQSEQDNLDRAKQQTVYYQSLIGEYRTLQRANKGAPGAPAGLPAIDLELDKLRSQLADLKAHYTDHHPDVRKVEQQIAETEKTKAKLAASLNAAAANSQQDSSATSSNGDMSLAQLESQLKANQIETANRERSLATLQAKINDYQGRLGQAPIREQQLADLSRGYEQSKANYDDLMKRKNSSALSTTYTQRQQGQHFRMIDPPSLPAKPDFPNRLKMCVMGLALGVVLGGVVAGGSEFMDDRIHSEKEFKELVPVAVISEIPAVSTVDEEISQRRSNRLAWAAATVVFAAIVVGTALSYLRG